MTFTIRGWLGAAALIMAGTVAAHAQTTLKWAHVYEASEPFHTESVWAAEEIGKRLGISNVVEGTAENTQDAPIAVILRDDYKPQ